MPGSVSHLGLTGLSEDVLIYILSFLRPPDIVRLCMTCKHLHELGMMRIVWTNTCQYHIIDRGFSFPSTPLAELSVAQLRQRALSAYGLAHRWLAGVTNVRRKHYISGTSGTSVSHVRFVPGHGDRLLLMISKSVWSAVAVWDMDARESRKVGEWSPRGAIFNGFALNCEADSEATLAVSVQLNGEMSVKILHLERGSDSMYTFREIYSVQTDMKPVTLTGNILALSDEISQSAIWDWRNGTYATLQDSTDDDPSLIHYSDCIQILFAYRSVVVVRTRSIHLFAYPVLKARNPEDPPPTPYNAIARHSFGWVDGVCVNICPYLATGTPDKQPWSPLSILVRGESDDPWASDVLNLELYTVDPNPAYRGVSDDGEQGSDVPPYVFPPRLINHVFSLRGSLRCTQIVLGRFGTAAWIQPQERFFAGLVADVPQQWDRRSTNTHESLMMAVFPGSLNPVGSKDTREARDYEVAARRVFFNEANDWTSFDYDEVRGRIALGSSFGKITILEL